ncbi:uncharacterized protein EMH_0004440 [Eimeria mitis]|uniref:BRCT domain-containing protein n=1 Tax=Eimeria mitis TaxID=44415 RepID=U6KGU9_9EIME|nr:uncharacterized protein EMH_0004440 [Eimeria mitis]CDJ36001.1 hypothetical protein, conserved [Eimeria mitis]
MPTVGSSISSPSGLGIRIPSPPTQPALFRGLSFSFVGFDAESLRTAAENASDAAGGPKDAVSGGGRAGAGPLSGALAADAAAAEAILQLMQKKAEEQTCHVLRSDAAAAATGSNSNNNSNQHKPQQHQKAPAAPAAAAAAAAAAVCSMCLQAGARVLEATREGISAAGFLICNFSAAFVYLSRLAAASRLSAAGELSGVHTEPHQVVAALELEPLRLLTPFWLFACLRDGRVYAPDAHALFRVSAALNHTHPPLWRLQQPVQPHPPPPPALPLSPYSWVSQRVLLLGFTRRLRRVRLPRSFAYALLSSDSEEGERGGEKQETAAGYALAAHDIEMAAACVEALGGICVSASSVLKSVQKQSIEETEAATETDTTSNALDRFGVDVVVVGQLSRLQKANVSLLGTGEDIYEPSTQKMKRNTQEKKKRLGAKAKLELLYKLQGRGIPCVYHQWLLDAYCFGRAPPLDMYAVATQPAHQGEATAPPSAAARRQQVLQGVQVLVADSEVTRDPALIQRVGELGCTDVTAIPSLLGICPWLFSCNATRELAAVLDNDSFSGAATCLVSVMLFCCYQLERAEAARKRSSQDFASVLFVIKREELAGLLDLAAVAAEAIEATGSQQVVEGAPTGRAASTRSAQRQQAPPLQQDPQQQKIRTLISAAQQRVLQQLPAEMARQAQRLWEGATNGAHRPVVTDATTFVAKRNVAALAETAPLAVSPEWIASCWAEARRVPVDSAHGRIEAPDFWADALASDSAGNVEDAALLAALQDCGGAVIYGDLPVVNDAEEARLRRAVGALEHALTIAWDLQQDRLLEQAP